MPQPDYQAAIEYALSLLRDRLSPKLTYHNLWHTQYDVMPAAVRLARLNHIPEADIRLLEVAAAFHDVGFIEGSANHEEISIQFAVQALPKFGFNEDQIQKIKSMIQATRLPQSPKNLIEQVLADADLDVLGREDFFERSFALQLEWKTGGQPTTTREWLQNQIRFLKDHNYFTAPARSLREPTKQRILREMEERLEQS